MLHEYSRSEGGASLTASFSLLMSHPTFKSAVAGRMTHEEKLRLFALHQQAVHGDAPLPLKASDDGAAPTSTPAPPLAGENALSWLDFAGKARQKRWESLRGRMTPQVAREAFCAEFLALLDKYPAREVAPLVEAALSRAASARFTQAPSPTGVSSPPRRHGSGSPRLVFCVRSFQHDPAALALLWVCRAYGIPCEVTVEPLSKAVHRIRRGATEEVDLFYTAASLTPGKLFVPFFAGVWQGERFVAEVAGPEAGFQLLCNVFLSRMPHWAGLSTASEASSSGSGSGKDEVDEGERLRQVRRAAEGAEWLEDLASITAHVRTPVMTLLIAEVMGVLLEATHLVEREEERQERVNVAAATGDMSEKTSRRQTGTALDVSSPPSRSPVVASSPSSPAPVGVLEVRACAQLRAVAAHLNHFQRTFVQRRLQRSRFNQTAAAAKDSRLPHLPSLFDADAAVKVVKGFYKRSRTPHRLVSCVDLYVACCGYVLCTSPFSQRLFPKLNSVNCDEAAWLMTRSSALDTTRADPAAAAQADFPPSSRPGLPEVRLPGMPPGYNAIINAVLRRESRAAVHLLDEPAPVAVAVNGASSPGAATTAIQLSGIDGLNAFAAADAMERYMLAQMLSLKEEDIVSKASGGTPVIAVDELVNSSLTPFMVLAHIFTGAWWVSQRQCVGFPFLLMAAKPERQVNFLWERKGTQREGIAGSLGGHPTSQPGVAFHAVPEEELGKGESFGDVDSWESRLRQVGWAVVQRLVAPATEKPGGRSNRSTQRRVYDTDGQVEAKL